MASANRASLLSWLVVLAGSSLVAQQEEQRVAPPQRFEKVLWCSDADAGPKLARSSGYTAVQLGRGGDPTPLRSQGLRFYLDQPIGKGLLELRDAQWRPVVQQFERTRDPAQLVRPTCFATPGVVADAAAKAAKEARRVGPEGLLFVALADEASSTRHNAPLDTCRCEHCLAAFRAFCRGRFADIDSLNGALGTSYASFDDAVPLGTDQVRTRELGDRLLPADLRAWSLWLDFVDQQFADAVAEIRQRVARAVPGVPVGLTGLAVPGPFGGHDYHRLLQGHTLAEPYDIGGSIELARGLLPQSVHRYETLAPPAAESAASKVPLSDYVRARLAAMACRGSAGVVVWNDRTVVDEKGEPTTFGRAVQRGFAQLGGQLDEVAGAVAVPGDVWVVESHESVRAWWMIDSARDGMTWVRRLGSYEQTHSTSQAARLGWIRLLQDLGQQPTFVASAALAERLLIEKPRCVVLPAMLSIPERTARALTLYTEQGGTVVADHSTGLYDDHLLRREAGVLDRLFGITGRSLAWDDLLVREGDSTARASGLPEVDRGLRGSVGLHGKVSDTFVENAVRRGRAYYLNVPVCDYPEWRLDPQRIGPARELRRRVRAALQRAGVMPPCEVQGKSLPTIVERAPLQLRDGRRVLGIRLNALERPQLLRQLGADGPLEVELIFPRERDLRELGGRNHGRADRCTVLLDPFGVVFVEVQG
jgi:hypothetical protein